MIDAHSPAETATHGLLSTDVERFLGLPAGSARKRRLTVLNVGALKVAGTELRRGDRLIVEPGAHASTARLLACRCARRIVLRRVRLDARGDPLLAATDPQLLPLPDASPCHVVGTVLAAIRTPDDGRTSIAFPPEYAFHASRAHPSAAGSGTIENTVRRANAAVIERALKALEVPTTDPSAAGREIAAAATRLRTLGSCLEAVTDERIYRALAREIDTIVLRLRRTLATSRRWIPLQGNLRPLSSTASGPPPTRRGGSRNPHGSHSEKSQASGQLPSGGVVL